MKFFEKWNDSYTKGWQFINIFRGSNKVYSLLGYMEEKHMAYFEIYFLFLTIKNGNKEL